MCPFTGTLLMLAYMRLLGWCPKPLAFPEDVSPLFRSRNKSLNLFWVLVLLSLSSASLKQEILVPEASEFGQWEPEDALDNSSCPVTAIIPTWRTLTTLDMSHNSISEIDDSVVRNIFHLWKKVWFICGT